MESNIQKKMIMQSFDTVAAGYDHSTLSFFSETAKRRTIKAQFNPAWQCLLKQLSEHEHREEIAELLGEEWVWFDC